jgi:predicted secreted hydrolase
MRAARILLLTLACVFRTSPVFAADPQFATVSPDKPVKLPGDTGAHPAFRTEWWYTTGWLETPDHQPLGFQITFFRMATGHPANDPSAFAPTQLIIAHAALSDPKLGRLDYDQKIARQGFGLAYAKPDNTDLRLDKWSMVRAPDGHYDVSADAAGFALHLTFTPTQAPLLQGANGYFRKGPLREQASYYYSEPQLRVTGSVTRPAVDGTTGAHTPVTGSAWLDHEWFTQFAHDAVGWDWLGANLSDGAALMAFKLRDIDGHVVSAHAALRNADGRVTQYGPGDVDFTPTRQWRSPRTNTQYPVATVVRTGDTRWQLTPLLDDQELDSRESTGVLYWEGAVTVSRDGQRAGHGYLELTGYGKKLQLERR